MTCGVCGRGGGRELVLDCELKWVGLGDGGVAWECKCFRRGRVWMFWAGLCVEVGGTECWKWVGLGKEGRRVI